MLNKSFSGNIFFIYRAIFIMALFSFLLSNHSYAQVDIDKLIKSGLDNLYSFKWTNAESDFNKITTKYPDDPRGYHFLSDVYMWYYLSNNLNEDYVQFNKYSDKVLELCEKQIELQPNDEKFLTILGTNYIYRSVIFNQAQKQIDAIWAAKKAETYLSKCLELNKDNYDAMFGLGIYNFAVGQIPAAFKWALSVAGVKGDKDTGIKYLETAAQKGNFTKIEAQYYLSQIFSENLYDFNTSSNYLKALIKKFPYNKLFNYAFAVLNVKQKNLDNARAILLSLTKEEDSKFIQLYAFSNFLLGDVYFKKNEFDSAKKFYSIFLNKTKDNNYTGIASYRIGLSYELTDLRDSSLLYYKNTDKGNNDLDDDLYAKRKGSIYYNRQLSDIEKKIIIYSNFIEDSNYQEAIDSLSTLLNYTDSEKYKAEILFYLSDANFYLGNYDKSLELVLSAYQNNSSEESWIKPYSCFNAARIYKIQTDFFKMKDMIDEADKYTDYDYQNKLKNYFTALKKVNF